MKKILFVNDLACGGGTEMVLRQIVNNLPENEYEITVITFNRCDDFYKYFNSAIEYEYIYENEWLLSKTFIGKCINRIKRDFSRWFTKFKVNKRKFDIVVSIKEGYSMKFVSGIHAARRVAWIHTDYSVLHWSAGCFSCDADELECMKCFDKVVCVSHNVMNNVKKYVGDSGNMCVLENPIDERDIMRKAQEKQNIAARPDGRLLFVTVGRLCKEKGYDMLIDACARLNAMHMADMYELWIVGGGELEQELKSQLARCNVKNVRMLGKQDNPYRFLKEADWFVSSSRAEGYAIAPQEAAILGIPIIATDCSGVRELLGDSEYGIVIESSTDAICNAMKKVLDEPEIQAQYAELIC